MWFSKTEKKETPSAATKHFVLETPMMGPVPEGFEQVQFGMGCFWGAERIFWELDGVWTTSVGYAGGGSDAPSYEDVCTGRSGHAEIVHVAFDPARLSFSELLKVFWESHNPTQGDQQGNDRGSQYRSAIFCYEAAQSLLAETSRDDYATGLKTAGFGSITTQIAPNPGYHYAELYHQQYLAKNPDGYCGIGGTGVTCPMRTA
ncbi:MAG: peptide-methionine (S)-S-oxide reductase MsrA [Rhodobacteraceae bacterium]|nr:peptide-methionine (S)-S-oxide reductase MsrA [Paracoccaceae bacterium]